MAKFGKTLARCGRRIGDFLKRHLTILLRAAVAALFVFPQPATVQESHSSLPKEARMHSAGTGFLLLDDARRFDDLLLQGDASAAVELSMRRAALGETAEFDPGQRVAVEKFADDHLGGDEFRHWYCVRSDPNSRCFWVLGVNLFGDER